MSEMKVFRFAVDEAYAKQHNELLHDTRRLVISAVCVFALSLAGAAAAWFLVDASSPMRLLATVGLALFGLLMLVVGFLIPRSMGTAQSLYDAHPLAPAIVAEDRGTSLTLLALVNTNADPSRRPRWAVTAQDVGNLPGPHDVGTRVPVVAVGGQRSAQDRDTWNIVTPMPIAWGTPDAAVIDAAVRAVPPEQWATLESCRDRVDEAREGLVMV
ncbi:DUF3239 domain-containing protein [Corynebacterium capitovis]|uniref:DUF3239 domain-containing protein n=1 Tax=Corynebacterium capitovis TaxID=131081 RepID=UPI0003A3020C|nr:DUF3239 domain-containing protein [Corynebacterium capitovis]